MVTDVTYLPELEGCERCCKSCSGQQAVVDRVPGTLVTVIDSGPISRGHKLRWWPVRVLHVLLSAAQALIYYT